MTAGPVAPRRPSRGPSTPRLGLAIAALLGLAAVGAGGADEAPLLVTVGEVTDSSAVLWTRGQPGVPVRVQYGIAGAAAPADREVPLTPEADHTGKLVLEGLVPGARYRYAVGQGADLAHGEFVTAPAPTHPATVRFAWSGDLGGSRHCRHRADGYPIFRALARVPVDFFLFVGDTVYADVPCGGPDRVPGYDFVATTLDGYRAKHRYNREDPDAQAYFRRVSVYGIWDDHEVRNNFSGPTEPLMPLGRRAFIDYFPIQPPSDEPSRLYRRFRWGALLELFILDTRQYRSPNRERDGPRKTMLGAAQRRWLIDAVSKSTATWKVVVSSVSLSVPTGLSVRDSWSNAGLLGFPEGNSTGFAVERDQILRAFRQRSVKNLVFVTADVHHAELIRHHPTTEWSFHEFIAGPMAAGTGRPRPLDMALNPRTLFALGGVENFGEVTVDPEGLTVRIVDVQGRVRVTHTAGPA